MNERGYMSSPFPHTHLCNPHSLGSSLELLGFPALRGIRKGGVWGCRHWLETRVRPISIKMLQEATQKINKENSGDSIQGGVGGKPGQCGGTGEIQGVEVRGEVMLHMS